MPDVSHKSSSSVSLTVLAILASVAALYLTQTILIPLALAFLLSFALSPTVKRLHRIWFGRVTAVLVVVALALTLLAGIGWFVAGQLFEIGTELPQYEQNLHEKIQALQGSARGHFARLAEELGKMSDEFGSALSTPAPSGAVPVQVVEQTPNSISARALFGPLVSPVEGLGLTVIFAIFLLLESDRLRDRLLRLVGLGRLGLATKALDDAARGVSHYLQMQFIVNATAGLLFALGLLLIGVPHALLWGALFGLFRFVPYIGPLAAAFLPVALTVVATDGWINPLLTLGLFVTLELILAQFVEPWLYGAHSGISSLAILVAGVFWGFLWGPLGLILSTPLTVCLVVLGRHVPQLSALHILLGDDVLDPEVHFYQRLLALDAHEAREIVMDALKGQSLAEVYDQILLPALSIAEQDRYRSELRDSRMEYICQSTRQIVEELANFKEARPPLPPAPGAGRIFCVGASDSADEITALMLAQVLGRKGWATLTLPHESSAIDARANDTICLCALPPLALMHARSLARELRARFPETRILVCLWNLPEAQVERAAGMLAETLVCSMQSAIAEAGRRFDSAGRRSGPVDQTPIRSGSAL